MVQSNSRKWGDKSEWSPLQNPIGMLLVFRSSAQAFYPLLFLASQTLSLPLPRSCLELSSVAISQSSLRLPCSSLLESLCMEHLTHILFCLILLQPCLRTLTQILIYIYSFLYLNPYTKTSKRKS